MSVLGVPGKSLDCRCEASRSRDRRRRERQFAVLYAIYTTGQNNPSAWSVMLITAGLHRAKHVKLKCMMQLYRKCRRNWCL